MNLITEMVWLLHFCLRSYCLLSVIVSHVKERHPIIFKNGEITLNLACFTMKVHDFKSVIGTVILEANLQSQVHWCHSWHLVLPGPPPHTHKYKNSAGKLYYWLFLCHYSISQLTFQKIWNILTSGEEKVYNTKTLSLTTGCGTCKLAKRQSQWISQNPCISLLSVEKS